MPKFNGRYQVVINGEVVARFALLSDALVVAPVLLGTIPETNRMAVVEDRKYEGYVTRFGKLTDGTVIQLGK